MPNNSLSTLATTPITVGPTANVPSLFPASWRNNPNYLFTLHNNGYLKTNPGADPKDATVQAYIPETFSLALSSTWEPFLHDGGGSIFESINEGLNLTGTSINVQLLSALIWRKTDPISLQFNLQFDSKTSALEDVTKPVMRLMSMISPVRGKGAISSAFLFAPGPSIGDQTNSIYLRIGRFFYMDSVVIENLNVTWHTAAEVSGDFIAADVEIQLKGWYTPDAEQIKTFFAQKGGAAATFLKTIGQNYADGPQIYKPGTNLESIQNNLQSLKDSVINAFKERQGFTTPSE